MSDPTVFRDEAVVTLNELPYLNVGGHPTLCERSLSVRGAYDATAATLLSGKSGSARFPTTLTAAFTKAGRRAA